MGSPTLYFGAGKENENLTQLISGVSAATEASHRFMLSMKQARKRSTDAKRAIDMGTIKPGLGVRESLRFDVPLQKRIDLAETELRDLNSILVSFSKAGPIIELEETSCKYSSKLVECSKRIRQLQSENSKREKELERLARKPTDKSQMEDSLRKELVSLRHRNAQLSHSLETNKEVYNSCMALEKQLKQQVLIKTPGSLLARRNELTVLIDQMKAEKEILTAKLNQFKTVTMDRSLSAIEPLTALQSPTHHALNSDQGQTRDTNQERERLNTIVPSYEHHNGNETEKSIEIGHGGLSSGEEGQIDLSNSHDTEEEGQIDGSNSHDAEDEGQIGGSNSHDAEDEGQIDGSNSHDAEKEGQIDGSNSHDAEKEGQIYGSNSHDAEAEGQMDKSNSLDGEQYQEERPIEAPIPHSGEEGIRNDESASRLRDKQSAVTAVSASDEEFIKVPIVHFPDGEDPPSEDWFRATDEGLTVDECADAESCGIAPKRLWFQSIAAREDDSHVLGIRQDPPLIQIPKIFHVSPRSSVD